jgi:hypothetical protein
MYLIYICVYECVHVRLCVCMCVRVCGPCRHRCMPRPGVPDGRVGPQMQRVATNRLNKQSADGRSPQSVHPQSCSIVICLFYILHKMTFSRQDVVHVCEGMK